MSLKKVDEVKKEKGFKLADLIVYGAIILLVAVLLITIFATRNTDPFQGVRVYVNNTEVLSYNFNSDKLDITAKDSVEASENDGTIVAKVSAGEGYNIIVINRTERTVRVSDANCATRDCVHTPTIKDNNGIIFCSPHGLRIIPFNFEVKDDGGNQLI